MGVAVVMAAMAMVVRVVVVLLLVMMGVMMVVMVVTMFPAACRYGKVLGSQLWAVVVVVKEKPTHRRIQMDPAPTRPLR